MSKLAKISFLIGVLILVASFVIQIMAGIWINLNSVMVLVALVCAALGVLIDYRMYWDFFTMRTTKHGMNMGLTIVIVVVMLVCVNYLANQHNQSWDLTQEKLNSLSDQSTNLLKSLKSDLEVKVFTRGPTALEEKQKIKQGLSLFQDSSAHLKIRYINPYVENELAMTYLNDLPDRENSPSFVFIENGAKRVRVDQPFDEAAITSALIKATRSAEAKVYFLKGHGEKDLEGEGDQSLREFVHTLSESSFKVESLNLLDKKEIPKDASMVAIVGPMLPYLDSEIELLRSYLRDGGHLFLALDPGQRHNLANLTKSLGVEFANNYVITLTPVNGGGPAMILGRTFDVSDEITKSFPAGSSYALFYLASEVKAAPGKDPSVQVRELVKTDGFAFTMNDIRSPLKDKPETRPVVLAVSAQGSLPTGAKDAPPAKSFQAVVFGDSDFLSNRSLLIGVNRDLAMNAFARLANQSDLISIRPKIPKGTVVFLTGTTRFLMVIFTFSLPLVIFMISGVSWFRRRGA